MQKISVPASPRTQPFASCCCLPPPLLQAANLLLDETGMVKIADFGVARVMDHTGIMTAETGTYRCVRGPVKEVGCAMWSGAPEHDGDDPTCCLPCPACGVTAFLMSLCFAVPCCRWMAPEVIEHNPYREKADVFRCGPELLGTLHC